MCFRVFVDLDALGSCSGSRLFCSVLCLVLLALMLIFLFDRVFPHHFDPWGCVGLALGENSRAFHLIFSPRSSLIEHSVLEECVYSSDVSCSAQA